MGNYGNRCQLSRAINNHKTALRTRWIIRIFVVSIYQVTKGGQINFIPQKCIYDWTWKTRNPVLSMFKFYRVTRSQKVHPIPIPQSQSQSPLLLPTLTVHLRSLPPGPCSLYFALRVNYSLTFPQSMAAPT